MPFVEVDSPLQPGGPARIHVREAGPNTGQRVEGIDIIIRTRSVA